MTQERVLIVGAGAGLSASLARACAGRGMKVALAARNTDKLQPLATKIGATLHRCDAAEPDQVESLFRTLDERPGAPNFVVYNSSCRHRGPFEELDAE
jgi:short-subunit dehydrogenase